MLRVEVLCTSPEHPVNGWLESWQSATLDRALVAIRRDVSELEGGDMLFLVSCHQIVTASDRAKFRHSLVLHASDLPKGRGMSPHIWQILEGNNIVTLSMLTAEDAVDTGDIWAQSIIRFDGTELYDEINAKIFDAEIALMEWGLANIDKAAPRPQTGEPTYYRRRRPEHSRINPNSTLAEVFDQLRVSDPDRYPAFFEFRGAQYEIGIRRR